MPSVFERFPVVGPVIKGQRELIEAKTAYQIELEEDVKDWRAIAAQATSKDISWQNYEQNHKDCWEAYVENPLAKGYVDRLIDFVIKDGFQLVSEDVDVQKLLESLEKSSKWKSFQTQACRELTIYGELFDRFYRSGDDFPKTRFIDPSSIKNIKTDPEDAETIETYFHSYEVPTYNSDGSIATTQQKTEPIEPDEIIHVKVNTVSTATRGISDLLCVLKWLKRHKIVFTNLIRRTNAQQSIIGEKIIKGPGIDSTTVGGWKKDSDDATSAETGKRKERTIKQGTWLVHSEAVEYKFTELPNDVRGMVDLLKMLNKVICAGFGLSEAWLGDTAESNLATTKAIELPILAKFERRQDELKSFFEEHVTKVLELSGHEDAEFEIVAPELTAKDAIEFANAMKSLAEGLEKMVQNMWISEETAAQTVGDYLDYFDSFDQEIEKIKNTNRLRDELKKEVEDEIKAEQLQLPPQLPPQQPPVPGQIQPEVESFAKEFADKLREVEVKFSKTAMDELIKDYAKRLVDTFNQGKKNVLDAVKEKREQT